MVVDEAAALILDMFAGGGSALRTSATWLKVGREVGFFRQHRYMSLPEQQMRMGLRRGGRGRISFELLSRCEIEGSSFLSWPSWFVAGLLLDTASGI